jgi:hypothetical protein
MGVRENGLCVKTKELHTSFGKSRSKSQSRRNTQRALPRHNPDNPLAGVPAMSVELSRYRGAAMDGAGIAALPEFQMP